MKKTIRQLPSGEYRLYSKKGKNLGTSGSKKSAMKREKQVQYFKAMNKLDNIAWKAIEHSEKLSKVLSKRGQQW